MSINFKIETGFMSDVVKGMVKPSRYEHSVRVAETARELCELYGVDPELGYFTGLVHDICKDLDKKKLVALAELDGDPILQMERDKPSLLHGRTGAMYLEHEFNYHEPEMLEAVRYHTSGKPGMCALAKILFVADKVEPGRPQIETDFVSSHSDMTLDEMVLTVLEDNIHYLNGMGYDIFPDTEQFLFSLSQKPDGDGGLSEQERP